MSRLEPWIREIESPLTDEMLRPLDPRCEYVQFNGMLAERDFPRLAEFLEAYPGVTLRAYGSYHGAIRDLEFLRHFPRLRRFVAEDLASTLENIDGLGCLPEDAEFIGLGWTRRRLSLAPLARFSALRRLYLEGQTKDIEVVSGLASLRSLTLRSVTLTGLSLLEPITGLRALDLKLGGTRDLSLLPAFTSLAYLELWMVRGLHDLSPVAEVPSLEMMFLQALRNVTELPPMHHLTNLGCVHLETMKGLRDLTPLLAAPALEELRLLNMRHLQPEDIAVLAEHPALRRATVNLGSYMRDEAAARLLPLPAAGWERHAALQGTYSRSE